jgi:hypothetical protein
MASAVPSFLERRGNDVPERRLIMAVKDPYIPPNYGMVSTAIERRIAGKPPASLSEDEEDEIEQKAIKSAPENKAVSVTTKKAPAAKRKGK